jgi:peptidyl-prolyl cis-trans isomerase C
LRASRIDLISPFCLSDTGIATPANPKPATNTAIYPLFVWRIASTPRIGVPTSIGVMVAGKAAHAMGRMNMRRFLMAAAASASALVLASCGGNDVAETLEKGQVVATVNDTDLTINQLNAELSGMALPQGEQRKQVEIGALQGLVNRTILADIARERGIDKTPEYVLQEQRAKEGLLVQLLQRSIASTIAPPSADEVTKFMADNPVFFAQRKIYTIDQIQFERPKDLNLLKGYQPLKTMDEVESRIIEDGLKYRRGPAQLDAIGANPQLIAEIEKLPPGEVFIIPSGQGIVASRVVSTKVEPFQGEVAQNYATNMLQQKKVGEVTEKQLAEKIKKAREAVKYQKGYEPPKLPPPAAAPAAAPAAPKAG